MHRQTADRAAPGAQAAPFVPEPASASTQAPAPAPAPTDATPGRDNLRGAAWALLSVAAACAMTLSVREASGALPTPMVVLLRSVIILAGALALTPLLGARGRLRFSRPWLHLLRGALMGVSIQMGFHSIANLPLAVVTALFFTAPIFATLLSIPINGERPGPHRLGAAAAGFGGALIILRPFDAAPDPAMLTALGSSLVFALALALSRGVAQADGAWSAFVSSVAATCLIALPAAVPVWTWPGAGPGAGPEAWFLWAAIGATALFGAVRGMADLESYRIGEAGVVGVISYLRLAALGLVGWIWYAETPDAPTVIGAAVIVAAALHIARRERLAKRRAAGARNTPREQPEI